MEISYGYVYARSSKQEMKGSTVESLEDVRQEYKWLTELGY